MSERPATALRKATLPVARVTQFTEAARPLAKIAGETDPWAWIAQDPARRLNLLAERLGFPERIDE